VAAREVRQPEVARLTALVLGLFVVVPVAHAGFTALCSGAFLLEFLSGGRAAALSAMTVPPDRRPFPTDAIAADLYLHRGLRRGTSLVLVHGFTPQGKDDPRVQDAAQLLARAGFDVAVPTISGLTRGRLGLEDVEPVVAAVAGSRPPALVISVSVGAGPALLAAADARVRHQVSAVLSLGGYASAREVVRFWLTGAYGYAGVSGRVNHDPEQVRAFVRANADRLVPSARMALEAVDPEAAERLLATPPPDLARYLDDVSPLRVARDVSARLILVHGRADRAVPFTESLRLADARPAGTTLVLVGVVDHVEGTDVASWRQALDLLALWQATYTFMSAATPNFLVTPRPAC
jgi:pimeloyl-ACP methyl ester carboxylesterase